MTSLTTNDLTPDACSHHYAASQSEPEYSRLDAFVEREKTFLSDDSPANTRAVIMEPEDVFLQPRLFPNPTNRL